MILKLYFEKCYPKDSKLGIYNYLGKGHWGLDYSDVGAGVELDACLVFVSLESPSKAIKIVSLRKDT